MSQPPWHLWGNTQTVVVPGFTIPAGAASDTRPAAISQQICRVPYMRPETFHFLFASELGAAPAANADTTINVTVDFNLTVGIGRSSIIMNAFEEQFWSWTALDAPIGLDFQNRTTAVQGRRNQILGSTTTFEKIDEITAHDIQLSASVFVEVAIAVPNPDIVIPDILVIVSAQFAPKNHVRPEWFEKIGRFKGHEDKSL